VNEGLILQHGADGPPGILGEWLVERGIPHRIHPVWSRPLAHPAAHPWIASLGSPHTPGARGAPPWVEAEVAFLRAALDAGVPVLGLCFGGQALAAAAGGRIGPADPPEIGWLELETSAPELIPAGPWLHYHYDQLEAPPGARTLARSAAGPAAFALDGSLGLQFHPESTVEIADEWARQEGDRLEAAGTTRESLRREGEHAAPAAATAARLLFAAWWEKMGTLSRRRSE
jgi:GMP synthase-like glutamine amidotransferase